MLRFGKFLKKVETEVVIARSVFHTEEMEADKEEGKDKIAVIYLNSDFAEKNGFKEGQILRVSTPERAVNLRVKISDDAGKPTIPNCIFSSFLSNFSSFKKLKAFLEITDLPITTPEEIINLL
jgi:formylmethanofuran dehydrogenase subunit D